MTTAAKLRTLTTWVLACQLLFATPAAHACTGITIKPRDGAIVFGRTLEFGMDLKSEILVIPRGMAYVGSTPSGAPGLGWSSKYAMVGANAFGLPIMMDGLNERGLHVGLFYFPGFAKYHEVGAEAAGKSLAPWELGVYLLGTCGDVKEAAAAAERVLVGPVVQKEMGIVPPVHYVATDATGRSIVIEHVDGVTKVHDNPLGVMSNSPTFDWHMTNLSNYVTLSEKTAAKVDLAGREIKGLGQGSGMLGLPGDFTPPSRFVRATAFSKSAVAVDDARAGVLQAFHILNQFDIPKGSTREVDHGQSIAEYTIWTSAADLKNLRYHFRTYENSAIRLVDLKRFDLDAKQTVVIPTTGEERIEDVSK